MVLVLRRRHGFVLGEAAVVDVVEARQIVEDVVDDIGGVVFARELGAELGAAVQAALEQAQVERDRTLRARRDSPATDAALYKLEQAATTTENLLPRILDCVESYATVGEISNRLRSVWGEYRETSTI